MGKMAWHGPSMHIASTSLLAMCLVSRIWNSKVVASRANSLIAMMKFTVNTSHKQYIRKALTLHAIAVQSGHSSDYTYPWKLSMHACAGIWYVSRNSSKTLPGTAWRLQVSYRWMWVWKLHFPFAMQKLTKKILPALRASYPVLSSKAKLWKRQEAARRLAQFYDFRSVQSFELTSIRLLDLPNVCICNTKHILQASPLHVAERKIGPNVTWYVLVCKPIQLPAACVFIKV